MRSSITMFVIWCAAVAGPAHAATSAEENAHRTGQVIATVGDVEFNECIVEAESRDRQVQCTRLKVPENYDRPGGKTIELFIVRLPTKKPNPDPDPVLFLAGGPGQAAGEAYLHID